jgi:hypothetical protein
MKNKTLGSDENGWKRIRTKLRKFLIRFHPFSSEPIGFSVDFQAE